MAASDKKKETVTFNIRRSDGFKTSSKLDALLRHLKQSMGERTDTGELIKSVVFSQFTTFLDLIEVALTIEDIPFTRLDGTQSQVQREKALKDFREGDITVMLISLRAGGVGLNLTCASKVYMMVNFGPLKALLALHTQLKQTKFQQDPWWNFATEAQAIDRVHRLGQKQEVSVCKAFVVILCSIFKLISQFQQVTVKRFIMRSTVEEKILAIQERKSVSV